MKIPLEPIITSAFELHQMIPRDDTDYLLVVTQGNTIVRVNIDIFRNNAGKRKKR